MGNSFIVQKVIISVNFLIFMDHLLQYQTTSWTRALRLRPATPTPLRRMSELSAMSALDPQTAMVPISLTRDHAVLADESGDKSLPLLNPKASLVPTSPVSKRGNHAAPIRRPRKRTMMDNSSRRIQLHNAIPTPQDNWSTRTKDAIIQQAKEAMRRSIPRLPIVRARQAPTSILSAVAYKSHLQPDEYDQLSAKAPVNAEAAAIRDRQHRGEILRTRIASQDGVLTPPIRGHIPCARLLLHSAGSRVHLDGSKKKARDILMKAVRDEPEKVPHRLSKLGLSTRLEELFPDSQDINDTGNQVIKFGEVQTDVGNSKAPSRRNSIGSSTVCDGRSRISVVSSGISSSATDMSSRKEFTPRFSGVLFEKHLMLTLPQAKYLKKLIGRAMRHDRQEVVKAVEKPLSCIYLVWGLPILAEFIITN